MVGLLLHRNVKMGKCFFAFSDSAQNTYMLVQKGLACDCAMKFELFSKKALIRKAVPISLQLCAIFGVVARSW